MTRTEIEEALVRAEAALGEGRGLTGTGFWKAVDRVRHDRTLADAYADRIAAIDRRAFEQGVRLRVPAPIGIVGLVAATALGVFAIVISRHNVHPEWFRLVAFGAGTGALILGTHSLAHIVVGRAFGMRFTHVFLGGPPPPRPGVKTDYASYLRATSMQRAWMHASGAVVTKIVPFVLIPFTPYGWLAWLLIGIGIVQIVTDITLSTKVSDWKKVKRELEKS